MPLGNLTIATRLRLSMSVILVLVVSLGIGAWIQAGRLADQTTDLYEHPLTVRGAIGAIETDVERIAVHVRDMLMAQGEQVRTASLEGIRIAEADAERQLARWPAAEQVG